MFNDSTAFAPGEAFPISTHYGSTAHGISAANLESWLRSYFKDKISFEVSEDLVALQNMLLLRHGKLYNSSQDHDEKKVGLYYNTGRQCGAKYFENCNDSSTELHLDGVRSYPPVMDIHGLLRSLGEMREPLQSRGYHSRDISWY